ncbi:phage virion morphogenesis protein [Perlucidibaca piscinae]|uniref:phage virion morphogenesis protein n=1 Tax=Perlucidibaca piscinae TaxID=392589 RepID=UPI0003B51466|nr:phage virion morphogenesis protein [Perlucidibaca piscinae]
MTQDLQALEEWISQLTSRLEAGQRRQLAVAILRGLQRSQAERISAQQNPDGTPFEQRRPRKGLRDKRGRLRRKMFTRLRQARYLKATSNSNQVSVGFLQGGLVNYIAQVHQEGRRDRVSRRGPYIRYPERQLIGFSPSDIDLIRATTLSHLDH